MPFVACYFKGFRGVSGSLEGCCVFRGVGGFLLLDVILVFGMGCAEVWGCPAGDALGNFLRMIHKLILLLDVGLAPSNNSRVASTTCYCRQQCQ